MKRGASKSTNTESGKRQRQKDQKEAFNQDRAEIYKLLEVQNDSDLEQHHCRESYSLENDESSSKLLHETLDENIKSNVKTENASMFEDSSELDKKWLAVPKGRPRPRIGDSYQAVLPSQREE
jgi:hypothetical protein